jgi:signal transduction histidine kinase/CheY-like chemotaxis protein
MNRFRLARLSLVVVLAMTIGSVSLFLVVRNVVADQEQRILHERAGQLALLVDQSLQSKSALLPVLGEAVASSDTPSRTLRLAAGSGQDPSTSTAVARRHGASYRILSQVGREAVGPISGAEAAVVSRASSTSGLVSGIVGSGNGRKLILAAFAQSGLLVIEQTRLGPTAATVPPVASGSPFGDVNLAFYASSKPQASALLLVSGRLPSGLVDRQYVSVGKERWLLLVSARGPLVGTFTTLMPWASLLVGLLATLLVAAIVEGLARRRAYALDLVDARTADLRTSLAEQVRLQDAERLARMEAERANQVKSQFISRMSHELRTPLNAVIGFGQLLERDDLNEDQKDSVCHILRGGKHLLKLVNEVLDIARIESGDLALSPEPVLVNDLLDESLGLIRPLASHRSLQIVGGGDASCSLFVLADRHRLKQVLLNLLSNAAKYNRLGGTISVACERHETGRLRIKVSDTGDGIPPEQLGRLFAPFDRLGAEQSEIEGTGIGLALARHLAEAMGGTLDVESVVGVGSTFWVELPLTEGPIERYERINRPGRSEPVEASVGAHRRSLLYIEDNLANVKLVERILAERDDIKIIPAMQGRLGLELAREHQPFLILLDLHLSDISGEEVLRRLTSDPETASIPVVILSADASPGQIQRVLNQGALTYLTKPIDVDELLRILDSYALATRS